MDRSAADDQLPASIPLSFGLARPADGKALLVAAIVGVGTDIAIHSGVAGLGGALLVFAVSGGLLAGGRLQTLQARALIAAAPAFGLWLFVRMSPWLLPLDVLAAGGLVVLGASLARGGSIFDMSVPGAIRRLFWSALHAFAAPGFAAASVARFRTRIASSTDATDRARATLRGLALAAPLLLVLGFLLASADALFASFFRIPVDVNPAAALGHVAAIALGAWGMLGVLRLASASPLREIDPGRPPLGGVETTVVLVLLDLLFAAFAAAQVVALSGGGRHVLETAGLTYAQYARTGFFRMLAVAAITLAAMMILWGVTDQGTPRIRRRLLVLSEVAVALTLVVVFVAVRRMNLHEQVFGLTMLRLYVKVGCFWIAGVFVLFGLFLTGIGAPRAWFVPAASAVGLVALFALNVANPEAVVVRHNVSHARATHVFDPAYLVELSEDAVPILLGELPELAPDDRTAALAAVCSEPRGDPFTGWAAANLSRDRADRLLDSACSGGPAAGG